MIKSVIHIYKCVNFKLLDVTSKYNIDNIKQNGLFIDNHKIIVKIVIYSSIKTPVPPKLVNVTQ